MEFSSRTRLIAGRRSRGVGVHQELRHQDTTPRASREHLTEGASSFNNALIGASKGATRGAMPDPRARLAVIAEGIPDLSDGPAVVVHDLPDAVGTAGG